MMGSHYIVSTLLNMESGGPIFAQLHPWVKAVGWFKRDFHDMKDLRLHSSIKNFFGLFDMAMLLDTVKTRIFYIDVYALYTHRAGSNQK